MSGCFKESPAMRTDGYVTSIRPPLAFIKSRIRVDAHPDVKKRVHNKDAPSIFLVGQFMMLKEYLDESKHC